MRPRWVIAGKELRGVFSERTILLAVVIQVFVAGFSGFLVVGLSALVDPSSLPNSVHATLAVNGSVPPYGTEERARLLSDLQAAGMLTAPYPTDEDAIQAFQQHAADGALLISPPLNASDTARLTLILPDGDLRATMTLTQAKQVLETYETQLRTQRQARLAFEPIVVSTPAKSGSYAFVYSLLVPLLVLLPVVLSGALCADSLTEEVARGTLPILLSSPASPADVIEGKLLANVAVTPMLSVAWFGLLALNHLLIPWVGAALILILATSVSFLLGLLACAIALATRDRNKAHVLYASAMFLLLSLSLALPVSPVNAIALLAAGSANAGVYTLVAAMLALAVAAWAGLRLLLRRTAAWMATGAA